MAAERKLRQQHAAKRDENIVGIMDSLVELRHQLVFVMGTLGETSSRMDMICERIVSVDGKVDTSLKGLCYVSELCESLRASTCDGVQEDNVNGFREDITVDAVDMKHRIECMERLLFHMPFDGYKNLDSLVKKAQEVSSCNTLHANMEPEGESSSYQSSSTQLFDIYECKEEQATQTFACHEDRGVQANSAEELCASFEELKAQLADNRAYRTLGRIGSGVYTDAIDQRLAEHIEELVRDNGDWCQIPKDHVFRVGDVLKVTSAFHSETDGVEIRLQRGYRGFVYFVDEEGDPHVWFPVLLFAGLRGKLVGHWCTRCHFGNCVMKKQD